MTGCLLGVFISFVNPMVIQGEFEEDPLDDELGASRDSTEINGFDLFLINWNTNFIYDNPSIDLSRVDWGRGEMTRGEGEGFGPNSRARRLRAAYFS